MDDATIKQMSLDSLDKTCRSLHHSYDVLYDKYIAKDCSRDDVFMFELLEAIKGIEIATYVYVRDGEIHPGYCLEKLNYSLGSLQANIRYWEDRLNNLKGGD